MTPPIFPFSISEPILDLTFLLTHPLGQEIGLFLITFIPTFLILWLLSNLFNFKKQDYKTSFFIALIIASTSFIIRSINLIFSLTDAQKPIFNGIAMIIEVLLLLILIKKSYNLKWLKSIFTLIITYIGRGMIFGGVTLIILLFFSTIPQDIEKDIARGSENSGTLNEMQIRTNFKILEPSYLPQDYYLHSVTSWNNDSITIHYNRKTKKRDYGLNLKETFMETKPLLEQYSLPIEETITINKEEAIIGEDIYDSISLTWYSSELKLLFVLSTGVNGGVNQEELIMVAESI